MSWQFSSTRELAPKALTRTHAHGHAAGQVTCPATPHYFRPSRRRTARRAAGPSGPNGPPRKEGRRITKVAAAANFLSAHHNFVYVVSRAAAKVFVRRKKERKCFGGPSLEIIGWAPASLPSLGGVVSLCHCQSECCPPSSPASSLGLRLPSAQSEISLK